MSTALDTRERWTVEVGRGSGAYVTRYSFDRFSQAVAWYAAINTHGGYKKRLVKVNADGSRSVIDRVLA